MRGIFLASMLLLISGTARAADCSNPSHPEGYKLYNTTYHVAQYCNGTKWISVAVGEIPLAGGKAAPARQISGTARAGCSNPSGPEGYEMYNTTFNVMQFCNGTKWIAEGPIETPITGANAAPAQEKPAIAHAEHPCPTDPEGWKSEPRPVACLLHKETGAAPVGLP
jgi:hypothetical protein